MYLGFAILGVIAKRALFYYFIFTSFIMSEYLVEEIKIFKEKYLTFKGIKLYKGFIILICASIFFTCIINFKTELSSSYIDERLYPIKATNYLKENINMENEVFFNDFYVGGYLEFQGIKPFIDSRSELYTRPFNDTDIFNDYGKYFLTPEIKEYKPFLDKYNITLLLLEKNSMFNNKIEGDETNTFKDLYQDEYFIIYKVK